MACSFRLETNDAAIVLDPGTLAPAIAFERVAAFLITHDHDDHVDVERVVAALAANPASRAWAPEAAAQRLSRAGAPADQIAIVSDETPFAAAELTIQPIVGDHATIHHTLPDSPNVAYLIDHRILHPGDAFPHLVNSPEIDVLFLPISGPWMRIADAIDYAAALQPRVVIPIHDGDLNEGGRALTDRLGPLLAGGGRYERLRTNESAML
ncbi:MBL fold metallo-hydrolase [Nocardia otitidiscaviarum]|uniref:MBL fold metallo-hydrolase n=1 Tax=Nocardia otitidiscaviarum TaxID=1823 RepID=UPI00189379B2|nr:MBL fold metallo-hydrolase [Nocardia otitidiscaviarum]MBF6237855.1 MBL fold metallo-hydrolase [Nocardia otitidiscaviarum]